MNTADIHNYIRERKSVCVRESASLSGIATRVRLKGPCALCNCLECVNNPEIVNQLYSPPKDLKKWLWSIFSAVLLATGQTVLQ